jgi:putative transposase
VPTRVSPTDRIHARIDELFASGRELPEILEDVARLGAQLLMQAALEAEVTEFLGRDRYARTALTVDARPGSRNGYREVTVKTTAGPVALARPKLRGTTAAFASRLFGAHVTKTNALESLLIASFIRGLSVRDVEATLADALGDQAAISKSTVSAICQQIKDEYQTWARRRLDEIRIDYLFASRGWRGLTMTAGGLRLLQDLRRCLLEPPPRIPPRTATSAPADDSRGTVPAVA